MITKKVFVQTIEAMIKQEDKDREFATFMEKYLDGNFVPMMNEHLHSALVNVLNSVFDDTCKWIEWWIYEKDFGRNDSLKATYKNGREIKLNTAEQLYDFLVKEMKG